MMTKPARCTTCGGTDFEWSCTQASHNCAIADGRLRMHDVHTVFVLGCNECSETLRTVNGDDVAQWMTKNEVVPREELEEARAETKQVRLKTECENEALRMEVAKLKETREKRAELVRFLDWLEEIEALFLCGYETGTELTETTDNFEDLAQRFLGIDRESTASAAYHQDSSRCSP